MKLQATHCSLKLNKSTEPQREQRPLKNSASVPPNSVHKRSLLSDHGTGCYLHFTDQLPMKSDAQQHHPKLILINQQYINAVSIANTAAVVSIDYIINDHQIEL